MSGRDVYRLIAEAHGFGHSERYRRVLESAMTEVEAEVGLALPKPPDQLTTEELANKLDMDLGIVESALASLFHKGFASAREITARKGWRFARNPYYLFMSSMSALGVDPRKSKLYKAWYDFSINEFYRHLADNYSKVTEPPSQKVLPYYRALPGDTEMLPQEDIRVFLKTARRIAKATCSCRQCFAAGGEPCKHSHDYQICMNFGRSAEFLLERGVAVEITPEEALLLFDRCEEEGLVHGWDPAVNCICNCCSDCCFAMNPCIRYGVSLSKVISRSRYVACTDGDACNGCKECVDRCIFGAIEVRDVGGREQTAIREEKCFGCGACVIPCPTKARTLALRPDAEPLEDYGVWLARIQK